MSILPPLSTETIFFILHAQMLERRYCQESRIFYDQLVVLHDIEESNNQLVVLDRNHIVQPFLQIRENLLARGFDRRTVRDR